MTETSAAGSSPDARFEAALKESAARQEEIRLSGRRPSEIISTTNVTRQFGQFFAVNGANLTVDQGSITALIGPNGSGKTTLMLMLAGLLAPTHGEISINGFDPVTQNYEARAQIGWMPDQFGMWESLTGREALITTGATYRMESFAAQQRAQALLELVHLTDLADQPAHVLSRGQKQRLGLARALMHSPQILILDEPANGLDPRSRIELRGIIRTLADMGTTILISGHVLAELDEMVDDAIFLSAGRTVARESVSHARLAHSTWQVRAVDPVALATWLDTVHVPFAKNPDGSVLVNIAGEDNASKFLADAIGAGVPLVTFAPHGGALEQTYLSLNEERR